MERLHYAGGILSKAISHDLLLSESDPGRTPTVLTNSRRYCYGKGQLMKAVTIQHLAEGNAQPWRVSIPGADAYFTSESEARKYAGLLEARLSAPHAWPHDGADDPEASTSR